MNFEYALDELRHGGKVCRRGWNEDCMWLEEIKSPDGGITPPCIYINHPPGALVPWLASSIDILSDDWRVLYNNN